MLTAAAARIVVPVSVSGSTAAAARFLSSSLAVPPCIPDPTDDDYVVSTAVSILREQRSRIRWRTLRALFAPVGGLTPAQSYAILLRLRNAPHLAHRFFLWDLSRHDLRSHATAAHILARSRRRTAALAVIKSAVRSHDSLQPPNVFTSLARHYHDAGSAPFVFDLLVLAYLDAHKLDRAVDVARCLLSRDIALLLSTSNSLIRSTANARGSAAALDLYREIFSSPPAAKPNIHTFNALLLSLHRDGDLRTAAEIRRDMPCEPNAFTYSISMATLCEDGLVDEAKKLWDEMEAKGVEPDIVAFNTLIGGYCAAGRIAEAEELYQQMVMSGTTIPPSCATFQFLIQGHSNAGDLDSAMLVYRDMKRKGLKPDTDTVDVFLHAMCEAGKTKKGLMILKEEMRRPEFSASRRSYEALICGFCREGEIEKAVKLQAEMAGKGFDASADVYRAFIEGYASQGDAEQAGKLRDEMRRMGLNFESKETQHEKIWIVQG